MRLLAAALLLLAPLAATAQDEPEYRVEVGAGVGMLSYHGDFGGSLFGNMQAGGSLLGRYRFNPRMALALNVSYGKLKGSSDKANTYYPSLRDTTVAFSNTLVDAGLRFEYNFWPYGTGREYFGAKKFTPYIALGIGMSYAKTPGGGVVSANVPIGVGVKYKIGQRLNLGLEWAMHFTLSDKLDGTADPYGIKSSGAFKNTDCYSMLRLSITYDIWAKCKICNNDRF